MNKSRPLYQPLQFDPSGRAHLLLTDLASLPALGLPVIETWPAAPDLLARLTTRLHSETIGLRLYAIGSEAFLWDVNNTACAAGLGAGEIFLEHAGSASRRVYCTHCRAIIERVTTDIVKCDNCGAQLLVRDHFSRRLAAFMAVAVDAEAPGEIPAASVLYP